jgi:4-carboxymuconolactone decarboxylase
MSPAEIDPESGCRIPLTRREELDAEGREAFDFYTSGTLRGLHGPAGIWLHSPKLAELYRPLVTYLRFGAGLAEPVREVCVLATAREFNNAFEWAAHAPEAVRVGVPQQIIESIKWREPSTEMRAPYGTVVAVIREAFTARSLSAATDDAAVALLGVPTLIDLIALAGMYARTAAMLTMFDMQLDAGETNLLPPLSDGAARQARPTQP